MSQDVLTLSGNLFTFESWASDCLVDTLHEENGDEVKRLRIRENRSKKLLFAYERQNGLVRLNPKTHAVASKNILEDLLAVPCDDVSKVVDFFAENGFLIPISDTKYEEFAFESVSMILQRIKFTVELLGLIQLPRKNYQKILSRVCWLTFMPPTVLKPIDSEGYTSCIHSFIHNEKSAENIAGDSSLLLDGSIYDDPTECVYRIPDSIHSPYTCIGYPDYMQTIQEPEWDEYGRSDDCLLQVPVLTKMFKELTDLPVGERRMVEFFYHFCTEIDRIKSVEQDGEIEFSHNSDFVQEKYKKYFNDKMKEALIDIAKLTVKEEIDYALYGVTASYDIEKMSPSWYIPDMITSLYFSLFYLKSDMEIYRFCENPNCSRPFLVSTTNNRRKYCCQECANAMAQRMHRKRKKEQASM